MPKAKRKKSSKIKTRRELLRFHETLRFPKGFLWGAATSAHQVEGGNIYSDWWEWEKQSKSRADSGWACNHYQKFKEDFDLIKKLSQNAYRFSIEWSRIEPKENQWSFEVIKHYREVLGELKRRDITTMVTLHHFTNPLWFSEIGGFTQKKSVFYFLQYIKFVTEQLGDLIDFFITINEPLVYATMSYLDGVWPPGKKNYLLTWRVYRNLAKAHKAAYQIINQVAKEKKWKKPKVGVAHNAISFYSYNRHKIIDQIIIFFIDWLWNHSFYFLTGKTHDFLGVNYYFHYRLKNFRQKTFKFFTEARSEHREMSSVGWEVYPQGIFDVLIDLKSYNLPIYITENGVATLNESKRTRYLISYVKEVYHAILAGVNIKGYFYWSLLDNFEWEKGFTPRFGLIEVNFRNFKRRIRQTAKIYSEICKTNSIPHKLLKFIGHGIEF